MSCHHRTSGYSLRTAAFPSPTQFLLRLCSEPCIVGHFAGLPAWAIVVICALQVVAAGCTTRVSKRVLASADGLLRPEQPAACRMRIPEATSAASSGSGGDGVPRHVGADQDPALPRARWRVSRRSSDCPTRSSASTQTRPAGRFAHTWSP